MIKIGSMVQFTNRARKDNVAVLAPFGADFRTNITMINDGKNIFNVKQYIKHGVYLTHINKRWRVVNMSKERCCLIKYDTKNKNIGYKGYVYEYVHASAMRIASNNKNIINYLMK